MSNSGLCRRGRINSILFPVPAIFTSPIPYITVVGSCTIDSILVPVQSAVFPLLLSTRSSLFVPFRYSFFPSFLPFCSKAIIKKRGVVEWRGRRIRELDIPYGEAALDRHT